MLRHLLWIFGLQFAETFLCEWMFLYSQQKRKMWGLRLVLGVLCSAVLLFLCAAAFEKILISRGYSSDALLSLISFSTRFVILAITVGLSFLCWRGEFAKILFAVSGGFAAYDVADNLYHLITSLLHEESVTMLMVYPVSALSFIIFLAVYAGVMMLTLFLLAIPFSGRKVVFSRSQSHLIGFQFATILMISTVFIGFVGIYTAAIGPAYQIGGYAVSAFMGMICLAGLYMMFQWGCDYAEKETAEEFMLRYDEQTERAREIMQLVNLRCHDMRHQIRQISGSYGVDEQYQHEVEEAIDLYDSTIATGNKTLDVLLTEKSLHCSVEKIELTVMLDGRAFGFMTTSDINSFFGNAVDNAVNALRSQPEDRRFLRISSSRHGGFLCLRFENPMDGNVCFDEYQMPQTQQTAGLHGYGTKSIVIIAQKYGGTARFTQEDGMFVLTAMFPVLDDAE